MGQDIYNYLCLDRLRVSCAGAAEQGDVAMAPTYKRVAPYIPTPLM